MNKFYQPHYLTSDELHDLYSDYGWFKKVFKFDESIIAVNANIKYTQDSEYDNYINNINIGNFYLHTVDFYRKIIQNKNFNGKLNYDGDYKNDALSVHIEFPDSVIQVASQFNCLE